jgi:Lon protease-like protein
LSDQTEKVIEAALFPIPNLVAFPGTIIPLHVFEPRYRQLVKDCLDDGRMIGVCHTRKTIRDAPKNQTASEMLNSNQATYQPQEVFSAGPCKLIDTTPDGRLLAEIHIEQRLIIKTEKQTLPYRIVTCELMTDEANSKPDWNPTDFSFSVFQYLRLDPDLMQQVLETRSTFDRLNIIWEIVQQSERS